MDKPSPFPFQGPLKADEVAGRSVERIDLAQRIADHRLTALLGPRRYGKTSLLRAVTADLAGVGHETIWVDLYEVASMADVASAFDRGMADVEGRLLGLLADLAATASIRLGVLGIELSRSARDRPDPVLALRERVRMLVKAAGRQPLVLVIDEFSGIAGVEHAAGILRTELQHHYRDLGIVFAGSQPSTMATLFSDAAQPFFAQADLFTLGPMSDGDVAEAVREGFTATGRDAGAVVVPLVAAADGHPQRAMQMADAAWRATPEGTTATDDTWATALSDTRAAVAAGSERLFALLPTGHQKVLRAVASGGSPYGTAGDVLSLSAGTARAGIEALVGNGYLTRRNDRLVVVDPLFADWLRSRFPV
ncbi:MAG: ATP-binding protein [Microthrixaceae bacterium]|nr:ATP-binding protein [Microthrixaceae bacterium]